MIALTRERVLFRDSTREIGVAIEVFQIAYIVITAIIVTKEKSRRAPQIIKEKG